MRFYQLDHIVLTVTDLAKSLAFYAEVLQIPVVTFGNGRQALQLGYQKINLHVVDAAIAPHAACPTPGSADICLVTDIPLTTVMAELTAAGVVLELGPVPRAGAQGQLWSIYIRDPDNNLVEIANLVPVS